MQRINFGCLIKLMVGAGIIALIAFVFFNFSESSGCFCRHIDQSLPGIEQAPYQVTTKTHIYYAVDALTNTDGAVYMKDWFERDGGEWIFHMDEEIIIPKVLQPVVERR